jgi:hypothetical protein
LRVAKHKRVHAVIIPPIEVIVAAVAVVTVVTVVAAAPASAMTRFVPWHPRMLFFKSKEHEKKSGLKKSHNDKKQLCLCTSRCARWHAVPQ